MKVNMFDSSSSHCLVGKFFTTSTPPSLEETEQSLRQELILSGDMSVKKQADSDTFLFEFRQDNDKEKVLQSRPFNVNGVILVIKDPNSSDMIDFSVASFYVEVVGLPSYLYTEEYLPTLKSQIGDKNSLKIITKNEEIWFRVEVDLKKPLRAGFYIEKNRFVQLKYLDLVDFCYKCGMIGHVESCCEFVRFHKERALNATSRTHVYGPWLRLSYFENCYKLVLKKSPEKQNECEKTLTYAQFFIELEFNEIFECDPKFESKTVSTHRFRFPCSYLDTETESTTTKAYEVIRKEIYENTPFSDLAEVGANPDLIGALVERLRIIKETKFCCDDKWLTLNLQINKKHKLPPVDYETMLAVNGDRNCEQLIESKILDLIKKRVAKNEDLLSLSSWENQITQVISKIGLTRYMHDVSRIAEKAKIEAVQVEISSRNGPKPADKSTVSRLERFKVLGSDMDRLDPCVICVGDMFLAEEASVLPCSHVFHCSCIGEWLQVDHKCPICRFELPSQKRTKRFLFEFRNNYFILFIVSILFGLLLI